VEECPDSGRPRAGLTVAEVVAVLGRSTGGETWHQRAFDGVAPGDEDRRTLIQGLIGHLEPQPN